VLGIKDKHHEPLQNLLLPFSLLLPLFFSILYFITNFYMQYCFSLMYFISIKFFLSPFVQIYFIYIYIYIYMHFSISFVRSFTSFHFHDLELRVPNSIYSDGYNPGLLLMQFPISFVRNSYYVFLLCIYMCSMHACLFVLPLF
jgi:hypothetical protein